MRLRLYMTRKHEHVFSLILAVVAFAATLIGSACSRSYHNLPPDLRAVVNQNPEGRKAAILHPLIPLRPTLSLALLNSDIYAGILEDNNSTPVVWRAATQTNWKHLDEVYRLAVLATDEGGQTLYAGGKNGVYRLKAGETSWQPVGNSVGLFQYVGALVVDKQSKTLYAEAKDLTGTQHIFYLKNGETKWESFDEKLATPSATFHATGKLKTALSQDAIYVTGSYQVFDRPGHYGSVIGLIWRWDEKNGWTDYSDNLRLELEEAKVENLGISSDGKAVWVLLSRWDSKTSKFVNDGLYWRTQLDHAWAKFPLVSPDSALSYLLIDPQDNDVFYATMTKGLYWTADRGKNWQLVDPLKPGLSVNAMVYHRGWQVPLVATDSGVYFLTVPPQGNPIIRMIARVKRIYDDYHKEPWFWPIATLGSFLTTYVFGVTALLLLAWQKGSTIFSRTWLSEVAAKPLLITPGLGRWALFLGYDRRLAKLKVVSQASKDYFGLPAEDSTDSTVLPEPTGESLHGRLAEVLAPQHPVMIIGKAGAGKSTLLARWAYLAIKGRLPATLKGFRPVLIPASYYGGNLLQAITDTLRQRDGVAVDEKIMQAQLQAGKFLILFDGVTEVETDRQQSLQEILRTARSADYQGCRFLITTRALEMIPAEVFTIFLRPLTSDVVSLLLSRYELGPVREKQVRRQLQSFGGKPIEPLLFTMAVRQSSDEHVSSSRAQLYERYFRLLLRAETNEDAWKGWQVALETLAWWFLLSTGKRGLGLPHEPLLDLVMGKTSDGQPRENLVEQLRRYYRLPAKDELDLLKQMEAAGLLQSGRRWRFAHDTFEEYFAASYVVSYFDKKEQWPILDKWAGDERAQEFLGVLGFVREMVDEPIREQMLKQSLPSLWQDYLKQEPEGGAGG